MDPTVPQQGTREFDQAQVVDFMLVVANQQRSAFRQPSQRSFHHPATRLAPASAPPFAAIFTDRSNVLLVA